MVVVNVSFPVKIYLDFRPSVGDIALVGVPDMDIPLRGVDVLTGLSLLSPKKDNLLGEETRNSELDELEVFLSMGLEYKGSARLIEVSTFSFKPALFI